MFLLWRLRRRSFHVDWDLFGMKMIERPAAVLVGGWHRCGGVIQLSDQ